MTLTPCGLCHRVFYDVLRSSLAGTVVGGYSEIPQKDPQTGYMLFDKPHTPEIAIYTHSFMEDIFRVQNPPDVTEGTVRESYTNSLNAAADRLKKVQDVPTQMQRVAEQRATGRNLLSSLKENSVSQLQTPPS